MQATEPKRIVVKIGSSSLTSLHGEISRKKLEKLVEQLVKLKDNGYEVLLVSSGAVAAGYRKLGFLERPKSLPEKQAAASIGQGLLMEAYSDLFLSHGYVASQILITRGDFSDETRYNNVRNTINVLVDRGIIPIINENDTVTVDRLRFGDNDTLSAKVAGLVGADFLAVLSDIDGLYTDNPVKNPDATRIELVKAITPEIEAAAGDAGSAVGTGGMKSKLDAFKIAMASGIKGFLGDATEEDIIYSSVLGEADGTYFEADQDMDYLNRKKQWIAFNSGPVGEIILKRDDQTPHSVEFQNISTIKGNFKKGDVVRILDETGARIGLGIVNQAASELWQALASPVRNIEETIVDQEAFVCELEHTVPIR
ncbi:glutamate 5-kinase [Terribacillus saccharophilus]|uniref:Glutamate 5-kinase n=1 Tax=Terribacillus saccharophilus TaxID=361277 RepID=A0ABX4GWC2_9BACI|nr:glutamate 5-kinase [Terribacillus saccharophilus]PAD34841.1 glutamate 5-kinase [Terribacillus saccharophilus]PAD95589.1 glutamate 5-kinase [Terribacillus saccharophilus]PAD99166.1 glutamate 5-kinase [Terribacillus saccharophilus]